MTGPLVYAATAGAAGVAGALLVAGRRRPAPALLHAAFALAAGFLLAVSLVALLPEALAAGGQRAALAALGGFGAIHVLQALVGGTHAHDTHQAHDPHAAAGTRAPIPRGHVAAPDEREPLAVVRVGSVATLGALLLHTLLDGVAIAGAERAGGELSTLVLVGVLLHKVPEGLVVAGLFLGAGFGRGWAVAAAVLLGAATVAGVVLTGWLRPDGGLALGLAAGVTLYVSAATLVPEVRHAQGRRGLPAFAFGLALALLARVVLERA